MAEICEKSDADVHQLAEILGHDARIGRRGMRPGLGFGVGCLPKDLRGFVARASTLGAQAATGILREADAVEALPGTGKLRAHKLLAQLEISESCRVRGLGIQQRELPCQVLLFSPAG
ncbi:hypothetical protein ACFWBX_01440 [Streptomyces sp. NPDC059991]|uniref:hypothetical protein n=1 Tax=Streptomyces sp. NPDC059991 TaxID=3347028 RepID=UPI0036BBFA69